MKNIFIIVLLCIAGITTASAQKIKVPSAAEKAFQQKFPGTREVKWEKEGKDEYEAAFISDGKKGSAVFSASGEWLETEMAVPLSSAPAAVLNGFKKANPAFTISQVYSIESKNGKHYFEIEYTGKGKKKEAKVSMEGNIM